MKYRCIVNSPEAVVQLISASYLRHGYYWYVTGYIPIDKEPSQVDQKLIEKYQIDISEWERSRRRKSGLANAQYIRYDRWFIILLTSGHHQMRDSIRDGGEGENIQDCRRYPITFAGYSVSYRRSGVQPVGGTKISWHAHVRIEAKTYAALKAYFQYVAIHRNQDTVRQELSSVPFARYAPVRRQLLCLLRLINRARSARGFEELPHSVLNLRRKPVKVYGQANEASQENYVDKVRMFAVGNR
jgi:hypothetical protein